MLGCRPPPQEKVKKSRKKSKKVVDLLTERAYLVSIERVIGTHYIIGR